MFKVTTSLKKILALKKKYRVILGGTSAGKTFAIMAALTDIAIRNPGKRITVVSMSYGQLQGGAIADFHNIMKDTGRWAEEHWHDTKHKYTFENGKGLAQSYIEFKSLDRDTALGVRRDILYVNEANKIKYETFNQLESRTANQVYIDYNPANRFWVDDFILNGPMAELSEKLVLTYRDNEACPPETLEGFKIKREMAKTSDYWRNYCNVYLDGQIGSIEGVVFSNWSQIDHIPSEAKLIGYGMDFGFTNDPTTCIAVYKWNDVVILDQIIYKRGLYPSDIATLLKQNNVTEEIYADTRPEAISEIRGYGFNIKKANKGDGSILVGIGLMQEVEILITNRSKETIEEFNMYSWKKNIDGSAENKPEDAFNHCIDATRYLFIMKMGKSNYVDPRYFEVYTDAPKLQPQQKVIQQRMNRYNNGRK